MADIKLSRQYGMPITTYFFKSQILLSYFNFCSFDFFIAYSKIIIHNLFDTAQKALEKKFVTCW